MATHVDRLVTRTAADEFLTRPMTELMARALQAAELVRHSTAEVVDAFFATRLAGSIGAWGCTFGTFGAGVQQDAARRIVERARVAHH